MIRKPLHDPLEPPVIICWRVGCIRHTSILSHSNDLQIVRMTLFVHNSLTLYCNASSMCVGPIVSLPARSATVRASLIVRWYPRGESLRERAAPISASSAFGESCASDSICFAFISALVDTFFIFLKRSLCRVRAERIFLRRVSVSPASFRLRIAIASGAMSPTETHISILSATGPEILRRYFSTKCGMHSHREVPQNPQGQGLSAAISMKFAGKIAEPLAREMETTLSSKGSRSACTTSRWNSGNSSRNKTPRCASVTSPGRGEDPPPISEAYEDV